MSEVSVRPEQTADEAAVRAVNAAAFGRPAEAGLVGELHRQGAAAVSLVAEVEGRVVGHIMFSPVTVEPAPGPARFAGLAPMAVLPAFQRQGVGSALIRAGLERCREAGFAAVVVLGHADYYSRFGFTPADAHGLRCEYEAPHGSFRVIELQPGVLARARGLVRYHPAFAAM